MARCPCSTQEGELYFLRLKARDSIWSAFNGSYKDAMMDIKKDAERVEGREISMEEFEEFKQDDENKYTLPVLKRFEENLEAISDGHCQPFVDYHMDLLKSLSPELNDFPQEIAWSYIRNKYAVKNNLIGFHEREHIVTFRTWYYNMFNIATLKFMDNPSLYDFYLPPSMKMKNIIKSKELIDTSVVEGIYASIDWRRVFECKSGPISLPGISTSSSRPAPVPVTPPPQSLPPRDHHVAKSGGSSNSSGNSSQNLESTKIQLQEMVKKDFEKWRQEFSRQQETKMNDYKFTLKSKFDEVNSHLHHKSRENEQLRRQLEEARLEMTRMYKPQPQPMFSSGLDPMFLSHHPSPPPPRPMTPPYTSSYSYRAPMISNHPPQEKIQERVVLSQEKPLPIQERALPPPQRITPPSQPSLSPEELTVLSSSLVSGESERTRPFDGVTPPSELTQEYERIRNELGQEQQKPVASDRGST